MTDPLRPFADMIRALWRLRTTQSTTPAAGAAQAAEVRASGRDKKPPEPARTLRSHLRARISEADSANPAKLRESFVAAVLSWELGEQVAPDPAFADMVRRVAEQLGADPAVGERLDRALLQLCAEPSPG
jgi:hypothetical protein